MALQILLNSVQIIRIAAHIPRRYSLHLLTSALPLKNKISILFWLCKYSIALANLSYLILFEH
ncbi:hypothetical protein BpHYR1_024844 [Brachionus plicatilis]|uniref:Uncharacterized protein n=1 Tax=Brachionus plicatilis TaxID=10195 RepID=A0A3M7PJR4_BRAPC|nr:hypothetical protein BpHYR1_024844 [Brachionus plicatilis]